MTKKRSSEFFRDKIFNLGAKS